MNDPIWQEMALAGLRRHIPVQHHEGAKRSISLLIILRSSNMVRLQASQRQADLYVMSTFAGTELRVLVEMALTPIIWNVGAKGDGFTG